VIVDDFHVIRVLYLPNETDAVLIVDPNTVLASAISLQSFKPVAGQSGKIRQTRSPMNLTKLPLCDARDALESRNPFAIEDCFGVAVAEAPDHAVEYYMYRVGREASNVMHLRRSAPFIILTQKSDVAEIALMRAT
jgi:hypothetical protein